jgi:hypothetical protein
MKPADVSSLRMLRLARDRIDRDYAEPIGIRHWPQGPVTRASMARPITTLAERGVEFTQPPAERPYGIEAIMRDDSGNWYSLTQRGG